MQELPYALLQHLWPQNTDLAIKSLYNATYRVASHNEQLAEKRIQKTLFLDEYGFAVLRNSAIQKLAEQAIMDKKIVDKKFKTQVFDVLMKF